VDDDVVENDAYGEEAEVEVDPEDLGEFAPVDAMGEDEDFIDVLPVEVNAEKRKAEEGDPQRDVRSRLTPPSSSLPKTSMPRDLSIAPPSAPARIAPAPTGG
jgi:hypothetical protein